MSPLVGTAPSNTGDQTDDCVCPGEKDPRTLLLFRAEVPGMGRESAINAPLGALLVNFWAGKIFVTTSKAMVQSLLYVRGLNLYL